MLRQHVLNMYMFQKLEKWCRPNRTGCAGFPRQNPQTPAQRMKSILTSGSTHHPSYYPRKATCKGCSSQTNCCINPRATLTDGVARPLMDNDQGKTQVACFCAMERRQRHCDCRYLAVRYPSYRPLFRRLMARVLIEWY